MQNTCPSIRRRALAGLLLASVVPGVRAAGSDIEPRVEALLQQMTQEEKIGQLTQYSGNWNATGPVTFKGSHQDHLLAGRVGAMLNVLGAERTRAYQALAMQSRLKIPLLFGQDVIHGYQTTFPIPLAEAASWDLPAIEQSARIAATEAAASGIHWTFAPMVDIARDPRWGRVMEGAGEDPYLGSKIAFARVKGFQGRQLGDTDAVMATAKHFAAYGAAQGGRDYNSVDTSERLLREVYLPPFKAAVDAGVATFMNAFNDLNGIPANGSALLQRDILKGAWAFKGFVVSDWGSIGEMVAHGYVKDQRDAARAAITAGSDMDMESTAYRDHLGALVRDGQVAQSLVDDAVKRVLRKKFELGLFEDPYRFSDAAREQAVLARPEHRQAARAMAAKSIVLLKNEPWPATKQPLLPLQPQGKTIAFIGPLVKAVEDNHGAWAIRIPGLDYSKFIVTQWDGLKQRLPADARLLYAKGSDIQGDRRDGFAEAVAVARQADVVVMSLGESADMSGEAKSRADLGLPGVQDELVQAVHATGKPVVLLVNAGRPLTFNWAAERVNAIAYTWWLGTEAGNAIADVLLGEHNPSARLPISFPRSVGQIPVFYSHFNTGRPVPPPDASGAAGSQAFRSHYIDSPNAPRYAFGHGLSYTQFAYSDLRLDKTRLALTDTLTVRFTLRNTGARAGDEVVQLYLRDRVGSVVRPVQELKGFQKLHLQPGQSRELSFVIDRETLSFHNHRLQWVAEPGEFDLMVGAASDDIRLRASFELLE
ncbi:MAG: beta-glucosidase BglX [Ideonella sp.]|nr:beta-glucosidase BglX [Ideonella sp.]